MHHHARQFEKVTVPAKANIFFEGKVVSHTLLLPEGKRKTLGFIYPGSFNFKTGEAEVMEILAGTCRVRLAGEEKWKDIPAGNSFSVAANSSFDIAVEAGLVEYLCSFG